MHRHSVGCLGQDQFESSQLLNRLKQCDRKYCLKAQDFPPVCPPAGFNGINGKLSPVSPLYVMFKIHGFPFIFYRSKPKNRKIHQKNSPQVPENHDQPLNQPLESTEVSTIGYPSPAFSTGELVMGEIPPWRRCF